MRISFWKGRSDYIFYCNINRVMKVSPHQVEEERCVFYVGVTRSMKKLYLTRSCEVTDNDGHLRNSVPSSYLHTYENGISELMNHIESKTKK